MPLRRFDLPILRARGLGPAPHVDKRIVEKITRNSNSDDLSLHRIQRARHATAPATDIVAVHRIEQRQISVHIEARAKLLALPRQVALHGESAALVLFASEPIGELARGAVRHHRDHARDLESFVARRGDRAPLYVTPRDRGRRMLGRRSEHYDVAGERGIRRRELHRHHSAERAADRERDRRYVQQFNQLAHESSHVARGHLGKGTARRIGRTRCPITRPEEVGTQHRVAIRVDRAVGPDDVPPPVTHRVGGTGECVEHHDQIVARVVQRSVEEVCLLYITQHLAALQLEAVEQLHAPVTRHLTRPRRRRPRHVLGRVGIENGRARCHSPSAPRSATSRSIFRSSTSSIPTDRRIRSSVTPAA